MQADRAAFERWFEERFGRPSTSEAAAVRPHRDLLWAAWVAGFDNGYTHASVFAKLREMGLRSSREDADAS
jgi:hypothetical protein